VIYGRNDAHPSLSAQRQHQIIHGQFTIVICLVPPPCEGTVNFSTLRWHGGGDGAGGTELTTGGESVGGSPNALAG
jgi:hypothetical protein